MQTTLSTPPPRSAEIPPRDGAGSSPPRGDTRDIPPRHDARALTDGGRSAEIALDGKTYLLRITRQGKLILTK